MAALALHELYVVTSWYMYSGVSLVGDMTYTDQAMAQAARDEVAEQYPDGRYCVATLDDYMRDMREQAEEVGRNAEREANNVGY